MTIEHDTTKEDKLKKLLALIDDSEFATIKSIVSELIRLISDPKTNAEDLQAVVEKDPLLSTKLLKLANSAYYGSSQVISDIKDAVVRVGFNNLKELALNQKVCQLFEDDDIIAGYSRALLWKHSVSVAIFGKLIYKDIFKEDSGNIYVAGLIHDIGIIIEEQFLMNEFFQILDDANSGEKSFSEVELNLLGYDHSDIGRAVAISWNFPEELSIAIGFHHSPEELGEEHSKLSITLYIADYLCHKEGIGYSYASNQDDAFFEACKSRLNEKYNVNVDDKSLETITGQVLDEIAQMESAGWF